MKKLFVLALALTMILCMFAACGNTEAPETNPPATNPPATNPPAPTDEATEPGEKIVQAGDLSNHENGWEVEAWNEGSSCLYFNMWTNDLPYNSDWSVRYQPHNSDSVKLIRDGEVYPIGGPGIELLIKFGANGYAFSFDKWITQELFPLQEGDVIVIEGDFTNPENGYTIHFDKVYCQLKVGGITKYTKTAPEGITE